MGLGAPFALLALLAVGVPLAAHLMRRRDLPTISLPTVVLLERAQAQSRRRLHLVDMLLLVLRIGLVAALVFGLASPYLEVSLAHGDGRVASLALVVDDSMSMHRAGAAEAPADGAYEAAREAVAELAPGSEVALVLAGAPARVVVARTDELVTGLRALERGRGGRARATDLGTAIGLARRELSGARHGSRRLLVLSDFAEHAEVSAIAWPEHGVAVELVRVGPVEAPDNLAIVAAEALPDPTRPGHASLRVELRGSPSGDATVVLEREGVELGRTTISVQQGVGRGSIPTELVDAGDPTATVRLEGTGGALAEDDTRGVLLRSPAALQVLLVDGDPHPSRSEDEVGYLVRALDADNAGDRPIAHRTVDGGSLSSQSLAAIDVVVLANVPAPSHRMAQRLMDFVRDGGGLLIAGGDAFEPRRYAARLGALLPAHPSAIVASEQPLGLVDSQTSDLVPSRGVGLAAVQTSKRVLLDAPTAGARAVLAFSDGTPALVVGDYGDGTVAVLATSLDDDWTDLPYRPGYLPLMSRLLRRLAPAVVAPARVVSPGTPAHLALPAGTNELLIETPDDTRHTLTAEQAELSQTELPGAYRVLDEHGEDLPRAAFLVAPPASESELSGAPLPQVAGASESSTASQDARRRPVGPWLFLLAGLFAVAEAFARLRRPLRAR